MTTVNCIYCGIAGVHPGPRKCVDSDACDLRMQLDEAKALNAELVAALGRIPKPACAYHKCRCEAVAAYEAGQDLLARAKAGIK